MPGGGRFKRAGMSPLPPVPLSGPGAPLRRERPEPAPPGIAAGRPAGAVETAADASRPLPARPSTDAGACDLPRRDPRSCAPRAGHVLRRETASRHPFIERPGGRWPDIDRVGRAATGERRRVARGCGYGVGRARPATAKRAGGGGCGLLPRPRDRVGQARGLAPAAPASWWRGVLSARRPGLSAPDAGGTRLRRGAAQCPGPGKAGERPPASPRHARWVSCRACSRPRTTVTPGRPSPRTSDARAAFASGVPAGGGSDDLGQPCRDGPTVASRAGSRPQGPRVALR